MSDFQAMKLQAFRAMYNSRSELFKSQGIEQSRTIVAESQKEEQKDRPLDIQKVLDNIAH